MQYVAALLQKPPEISVGDHAHEDVAIVPDLHTAEVTRDDSRRVRSILVGALDALFGPRRHASYPGLRGKRSAQAIGLAFDEGFDGDRVGAFIEGMLTMLADGYDGKEAFYIYDILDPQKIYYLARNFEIAFWKLRNDRDGDGQLFLLSNSTNGGGNLSFERLAGKLIALQDLMAKVVADSSNRQIKNVIQRVTSVVFFPI